MRKISTLNIPLFVALATFLTGCAGPHTPAGAFLDSRLTSISSDMVSSISNGGRQCGFVPVSLQSNDRSQVDILLAMDIGSEPKPTAGILLWQNTARAIVRIAEYDPKAYHNDGSDLSPAARTSFDCFEKELERTLPGVFYRQDTH